MMVTSITFSYSLNYPSIFGKYMTVVIYICTCTGIFFGWGVVKNDSHYLFRLRMILICILINNDSHFHSY